MPHKRYGYRSIGGQIKGGLRRRGGLEWARPESLEVDGVGQDQASQCADAARGKQILDTTLGLVFHPAIDHSSTLFGVLDKVELLETGAKLLTARGQKVLDKRITRLSPEAIGDREPVALPGALTDSRKEG